MAGQFIDAPAPAAAPTGQFVEPTPQATGRFVDAPAPTSTPAPTTTKPHPIAALKPLDNAVRKTKIEQHKAAIDPIGWVDAVLGGPQRFTEGLITSHGDLGHGWQVMTHPGDKVMQEAELKKMMKTFHISEPEGNSIMAKVGRFGIRLGVTSATDPINLIPILGQFRAAEKGVVALREAAAAIAETGARLPAVEKAGKIAETMGASSIRRTAKQFEKARSEVFDSRPELRRAPKNILEKDSPKVTGVPPDFKIKAGTPLLTKQGVKDRIGIEEKHRSYESAQGAHTEAVLAERKEVLKNMKPGDPLPDDVRREYDYEAWAHGTDKLREQVLAQIRPDGTRQFVPTPEELRAFPKPTGALKYDYRENYQTLINPKSPKSWDDQPILRDAGGWHKEELSGFEKRRGDRDVLETDQYERTRQRLAMGRARVRQVLTDRETEKYFNGRIQAEREARGLPKDYAVQGRSPEEQIKLDKMESDARKAAGWEHDGPVDASLLSHAPVRVAPGSPLRASGRLQKMAISINPFPHFVKNVGELAFMHGGPEAFGKGLGYASKGLSEEQAARHVEMGTDPTFIREFMAPLTDSELEQMSGAEKAMAHSQAAFKAWTDWSSRLGSRVELGYRQALLDQLDRKWPRLEAGSLEERALELKKGGVIRDALGDYRNTSRFVSTLEALGGPFVAFRVGIVPGATMRALVRRPGYVETVARSQELYNDVRGGPSEGEMGGPLHDMGRLATNPFGYITDPSSLGPAGIAKRFMDPNTPVTSGEIMGELGRDFFPGVGVAQNVGLTQNVIGGYPPAPGTTPWENAFASIFGAYYRKRPSQQAEQMFERREQKAP